MREFNNKCCVVGGYRSEFDALWTYYKILTIMKSNFSRPDQQHCGSLIPDNDVPKHVHKTIFGERSSSSIYILVMRFGWVFFRRSIHSSKILTGLYTLK